METCKACGCQIDYSEFFDAGMHGSEALMSGYCATCYLEKFEKRLPKLYPSVPAPGSNLTKRQQYGQGNTDGG
jgi:hypothetical protein